MFLQLLQCNKDQESNKIPSASERSDSRLFLKGFLQASLEGGALFASYEGSINLFESSAIPEVLRRFLSQQFLDLDFFITSDNIDYSFLM